MEKRQVTYQEAYKKAVRNLNENQISDAESDAWILMEHVTGMNRTRYYVDGFDEMDPEDVFLVLPVSP